MSNMLESLYSVSAIISIGFKKKSPTCEMIFFEKRRMAIKMLEYKDKIYVIKMAMPYCLILHNGHPYHM